MRIAIKTQFAALAAGALMIGLTVAAPTARAAEIVDRSAIVSDSNPMEMQRRGGFRAGPAGRWSSRWRRLPWRALARVAVAAAAISVPPSASVPQP